MDAERFLRTVNRKASLVLCEAVVLSVGILAVACAKPPEAFFRASTESGKAPLQVSLTNTSKNGEEFNWDFGDGQSQITSNIVDPVSHEYTKVGTYKVILVASKKNGKPAERSTSSLQINVAPGGIDRVEIKPTDVTVVANDTQIFTATAFDRFGNEIPDAKLEFSADPVAGYISGRTLTAAKKVGTADKGVTVNASDGQGSKSVSAKVVVTSGALHRVNIEPTQQQVEVNKTQKFIATPLDEFDNVVAGISAIFTSDEKAGTVAPDGTLTTAKKIGLVERAVTASFRQNGTTKSAVASVTLMPGPLAKVTIFPAEVSVEVGKEQQFTATVSDEFDNQPSGVTVTFTAVASAGTTDANGKLAAANKTGALDLAMTAHATQGAVTKTSSAKVILTPGPLDSVTISPEAASLEVITEKQFVATAFDLFGNTPSGITFTYTAAPAAGIVTADGRFTAATKTGAFEKSVTVQAVQGSLIRSAAATVTLTNGPLAKVKLSPGTASLNIGQTQQFEAAVFDQYDNTVPGATVAWSLAGQPGTVSGTGVFTAGTIAGEFKDSVVAKATSGSKSAESKSTITVNPDPLASVTLAAPTVVAGAATKLTAKATDKYANDVSDATFAWTLKNAKAGRVAADGTYTSAKISGDYAAAIEVKATQGQRSATAIVAATVNPGLLSQAAIAPERIDVGLGMTQQFVAAGADEFGNLISGLSVQWGATMPASGGSISPSGLFTAGSVPGVWNGGVTALLTQAGVDKIATSTVTVEADRIVFTSDRNDDQFDLYSTLLDGTVVLRLTNTQTSDVPASFSPDGRRIAFHNTQTGIYFVNTDGLWLSYLIASGLDSSGKLASYPQEPSWSPDGKRLVFSVPVYPVKADNTLDAANVTGDLWVIDADGSNLKQLTNTSTTLETSPIWLPDGKRILFRSRPQVAGGTSDLYMMNEDGSGLQQLTNDPRTDAIPAISTDGKKIAFVSNRDGDTEIFVMNVDGTGVVQLTANGAVDSDPYWSPDGSKIVFYSDRDGDDEIYIMNADGSGQTQVTTNTKDDGAPVWSPRKRGVEVTLASIIFKSKAARAALTPQEVTTIASSAVVRIETDFGSGSGFIFDTRGLILTNNHVITGAKTITVKLTDGRTFTGTVLGRDLVHDLAVVKITSVDLPTVELGDVSSVGTGSDLLVLGYPLGTEQVTITRGLYSATKPDSGRNILWIQTDAIINPGNSGGPVFNVQGQVIGVVTSKIVGSGVEGTGFAIPISTVKVYLDRMIKGETITR